ncbi:SCO family protein [Hahella ganghwensis]|uniref:SCO family protein n=1 Tax=Hahella ganghwensis TaxID=286420 RepID=UPI000380F598|nr:SCO family protein [Hahella ganghwensis]
MMKSRLSTLLIAVSAALVGLLAGWYFTVGKQVDAQALAKVHTYVYPAPRTLQPVTLTNLDNQPSSLADYQGQWVLVNFGYLSCPDICPTNLAAINTVMKRWKEEFPAYPVKVVHVTLDPARDTPERLKEYLQYFDPDFAGLTGSVEKIRALAVQLNTVFEIEEPDEEGNYIVSHSDNMALVNPAGEFVAIVKGPHKAEALYTAMEGVIPPLTSLYDLTAEYMPCH